jgi:hypothetical protein
MMLHRVAEKKDGETSLAENSEARKAVQPA